MLLTLSSVHGGFCDRSSSDSVCSGGTSDTRCCDQWVETDSKNGKNLIKNFRTVVKKKIIRGIRFADALHTTLIHTQLDNALKRMGCEAFLDVGNNDKEYELVRQNNCRDYIGQLIAAEGEGKCPGDCEKAEKCLKKDHKECDTRGCARRITSHSTEEICDGGGCKDGPSCQRNLKQQPYDGKEIWFGNTSKDGQSICPLGRSCNKAGHDRREEIHCACGRPWVSCTWNDNHKMIDHCTKCNRHWKYDDSDELHAIAEDMLVDNAEAFYEKLDRVVEKISAKIDELESKVKRDSNSARRRLEENVAGQAERRIFSKMTSNIPLKEGLKSITQPKFLRNLSDTIIEE